MMKLVIVESPNKVKSISKYLGDGYKVAASVGHVRDLDGKDLSIDLETFKPKYYPTDRGAEILERLGGLVKNAYEVFLATDPDREGEAIAWHLAQALKLKDPSRVTFGEITKAGVAKGMAGVRRIDLDLVAAQEGRRVIDRLVGWLVSPRLSRALGSNEAAGRVQAPALRIVVEREEAIRAFRATDHFRVVTKFDGWSAAWVPTAEDGAEDTSEEDSAASEDSGVQEEGGEKGSRILVTDRKRAEAAAAASPHKVVSVRSVPATENPAAPFTTASLQQAASRSLNIKPSEVAAVSQTLFEKGLITYHRTDSANISDDAMPGLQAELAARGVKAVEKRREFRSKEGAQEGHEAIRPTDPAARPEFDDRAQARLYNLILLRTLASQAAACRVEKTSVLLDAEGDGQTFRFAASGRRIIDAGWRALYSDGGAEVEGDVLPKIVQGEELRGKSEVIEARTKPPGRYTEAALIGVLERQGIGRPSTYSAILTKIEERGYWELEKKALKPTERGSAVIKAQRGAFSHADLTFTKQVEALLDQVAAGKRAYIDVVKPYHARLEGELAAFVAAQPVVKCPKCGIGEFRRLRKGEVAFWACSDRDDCGHSANDNNGKPAEAIICGACGKGNMRRMSGSKGPFWSCSAYPVCKETAPDDGGKPGKRGEQKGGVASKAKAGAKSGSAADRLRARVAQSGGRGR
jgi:DNA topoisomerase-1